MNLADIGFIGLGQMGAPIAHNLLKAGHSLTVWNRSPEKMRDFIHSGCAVARYPSDCARHQIVFSMLSDDAALSQVVWGEHGLLSVHSGALHVSLSTISPELAIKLERAHAQAGGSFVSAPVFGRPLAAQNKLLFIIAAGSENALTICAPLFSAIGQKTITVGHSPSAANLIKLCGNFMIMSAVESLAEAMTLASRSGVDKKILLNALTSSVFTAPLFETYGQILIDKNFKPAGFTAPLGLKDMTLVAKAAESAQMSMPILDILCDHIGCAIAQEGEDVDWSAIGQVVENKASASKL
jgi:3-hydroxyisobutyrate dehydrogenase-like beta-hydroxyacid dehydrogenase